MSKHGVLLIFGIGLVSSHFVLDYFNLFAWPGAFLAGGVFIVAAILLSRLPIRYLNAWLRLAYWAFPLLFGMLLYVESGVHESPQEMWPGMMDPFYIAGLYGLFTIGSLIQLLREWRKANRERYGS